MAYTLTHKVLSPSNNEKTNVRLTDALFHESTITTLEYYGTHDYPQFKGTAKILQMIRDWFRTISVRKLDYSQRTRDKRRMPIRKEDREEQLTFLQYFYKWLKKWQEKYISKGNAGSSKETFAAALQTTNGLVYLANYLLEEKGINYVLLGNIQSHYHEQRFGRYQQLCGANYYLSVPQFLQGEKNKHSSSFAC